MARLEGKVAIITGAARGQGEAEARLFAAEGARVVLADVLDEQGEKVAAEIGGGTRYRHLDVTSEEDWQRVVDETRKELGRIDVLVNNAAILRMGFLEQARVEDFRALVDVNLLGTFLGVRAVIPAMREGGGGSIVNVSSIDGMAGMPAAALYAATKYGVRGLTKSVALEVAQHGVRVNALCPGVVETPMTKGGGGAWDDAWIRSVVPLGHLGQPQDMAQAALFLASDESRYCTGMDLLCDGGVLAGSKFSGWLKTPKVGG